MDSRLNLIKNHLTRNKVSSRVQQEDDVVICCAVRTALTKSKRGGFKDTPIEILTGEILKAILQKTKIKPECIDDVVIGNVLAPGSAASPVRMGMFLAGIPDSVPCFTIDRLCSSGLEAVSVVATKIKAGLYDVGIAGGVEQMTHFDMAKNLVPKEYLSKDVYQNEQTKKCLLTMGETSENVAELFGISREVQDKFAVESHAKAARAQEQGLYDEEIIPVKTILKDAEENVKEIIVTKDEGIRKDTTLESLQKLKTVFKQNGSTTPGNASQISDGAAGVLLAKRSVANKLGLPIIGRFVTHAVVGVPPEIMGIGPAYAIPAALKQAGLTIQDISVYEINEAFASQATYCINKLGIDIKKVNPKGGAIALGHPLGCTGARQIATLLPELRRTNGKYGVVSMCIGTGMGAAAVIEIE